MNGDATNSSDSLTAMYNYIPANGPWISTRNGRHSTTPSSVNHTTLNLTPAHMHAEDSGTSAAYTSRHRGPNGLPSSVSKELAASRRTS